MRHVRSFLLIAFFALAFAGAGNYLHAQTADELQDQIDASNAQIRKLQAEIAALEKDLNATVEQKTTLQNAVNALNLNIQKLQKNITLTQTEIKKKDGEIGEISGSIATTLDRIDASQTQIADSLRQLEAIDQQPLVALLLSGATLSSFFDEAANLEALRTNLQQHIRDLSSMKSDLEEDKSAAQDKRKELGELNDNLGQQKQGLTIAKSEQTKLLDQTKNQESAYQAQIAQKKAEQQAFEATLFELASKLDYTLDPTHVPKAGPGVLRWPLDSVFVTQQFGKTSDSGRLYTSGTHDGVDFRAAVGTPVRAALSGVVMEINTGAVQNCQYGKWVLVKHNNGLATLYAHLSQIAVQKGEAVATGEVIGYAGSTGYATGPHLHFTVYLSEAVSLKQYTCKSGYTVTIPIAPPPAYLNPLSYLPPL